MNNLADEKINENISQNKAGQENNCCDSETILQITNLEKKYVSDSENLIVLHDLNLTVKKGKKIALNALCVWQKSAIIFMRRCHSKGAG